jgi:hypothetical protein
MNKMRLVLTLAVAAAVLGVAGVALAIVEPGEENPAPPFPVGEELLRDIAPSGDPLKVSRVETKLDGDPFCYEISTGLGGAQGCQPLPDENGLYDGRPITPGWLQLGTDRFVTIVAPTGVDGMRVSTPDSETSSVEARMIPVDNVGRLLLATFSGPPVTSERPEPAHRVELLDSNGQVVREFTLPTATAD